MYFRLIPLLFPLLAAHLAWADQAPESDQLLQRLTETQSFSLGRPLLATPTTDGKSVIFLRAISAQDRTHALYEFNTVTRETSVLVTPDELLNGMIEHLSVEERARRERTRTTIGGITPFKILRDSLQVVFCPPGKIVVFKPGDGKANQLGNREYPAHHPTPSP